MPQENTRRSLRRFNRYLASTRRNVVRRLRQVAGTENFEYDRLISRTPTRQERRVAETFEQELMDVTTA